MAHSWRSLPGSDCSAFWESQTACWDRVGRLSGAAFAEQICLFYFLIFIDLLGIDRGRLFTVPNFPVGPKMSIVEFDRPPSWSFDASETGRVQNRG